METCLIFYFFFFIKNWLSIVIIYNVRLSIIIMPVDVSLITINYRNSFMLLLSLKRTNRRIHKLSLLLLQLYISMVQSFYRIGIGIADITGPPTGVTFMGYGQSEQIGMGIHLRQFSRAFVIEDGSSRITFVCIDAAMVSDNVKLAVLTNLKGKLPAFYNEDNLMISSTHTHSTPGGHMLYTLFDLSTQGYVPLTFISLVKGITLSIIRAHEKMGYGRMFLSRSELLGISINRSPQSYLLNPENERAEYEYDVDKTMVQVKFENEFGTPMGVINWYAVHATSMNNTNKLISSDNLGYASVMFEQKMNPENLIGKGQFVAAFASANEGDSSPNVKGPRCQKTGKPCDIPGPSCGQDEQCIASGPGRNMKESTKIIAERLFEKAFELMKNKPEFEITGPIKSIHQYINMTKEKVEYNDTYTGELIQGRGCKPALGHTFSSGTTDGPGLFSFKAGSNNTKNFLWNLVTNVIPKPSKEQVECHTNKSILLSTGEFNYPAPWSPNIVSTQLAMIGQLIIICVPGEFTTMSGRRLRKVVTEELCNSRLCVPVIAGLCNTYSDYVTTPEEYRLQRYEGASTIYGPHTLPIYLKQYAKLSNALSNNNLLKRGPEVPDFSSKAMSFIGRIWYDAPITGHSFGDCILQPPHLASWGDTVKAKFVAGNPRNNPMLEMTFLTIERLESDSKWEIVATDANWETEFTWETTSWIWATSVAEIKWNIPKNTKPGIYRIRHFGYFKYYSGNKLGKYYGNSDAFRVTEK
ncbi:neutral ceramidase-like [Daktulosphaira vitifoliae]|uniref:neutral ceramidase-like n=1 Tax=Daktulosphaira vitifoliae TaxID=58002 RepID=UPI0021AA318E|nr:neutral ceramidase-like [Daktulosphaira vitifoliae]